jgi:hypothetical protein
VAQCRWTPTLRTLLFAAIEHVEYEVRWLSRGHHGWHALRNRDPDLAKLAFEAALISCRVLVDFPCPRANPRDGDVLGCEYIWPGGVRPRAVLDVDEIKRLLGASVPDVRTALDGWLAHLGSLRLDDPDKPGWDHVLAGSRAGGRGDRTDSVLGAGVVGLRVGLVLVRISGGVQHVIICGSPASRLG